MTWTCHAAPDRPGVHLVTSLVLAVGLRDDQFVVLVQADIDCASVGLGDLDLAGGAVLRIALHGVGIAARVDPERGGLRLIRAETGGPALVGPVGRDRRAGAGRREGEHGSADDQVPP